MPTKQSTTKINDNVPMKATHRYYSELARLTTGLFISLIALMAFLLTVGLSHPGKTFQDFVYAATILLPLSLLAYVVGQAMHQMLWAKGYDLSDKNSSIKGKLKTLRITRAIQQVLFVLGVIAITGLALTTAHFFFAAQAQQEAQPSSASAAPAQ